MWVVLLAWLMKENRWDVTKALHKLKKKRSIVCPNEVLTAYNTTQHNTTQHNTTQHNTTQHSFARFSFLIMFFYRLSCGNSTNGKPWGTHCKAPH
jgi:hypothetical protein